jgi:predicted AAA+ superfamily ATPase
MMCVTNVISSAKDVEDKEYDLFGVNVSLNHLDFQAFLSCVEEMATSNGLSKPTFEVDDGSFMDQAQTWARARNTLSVRYAAQFIRSIQV